MRKQVQNKAVTKSHPKQTPLQKAEAKVDKAKVKYEAAVEALADAASSPDDTTMEEMGRWFKDLRIACEKYESTRDDLRSEESTLEMLREEQQASPAQS